MMLNEQNPHDSNVSKQPGYEMVQYGTPPPMPPGPIIHQPQVDWSVPRDNCNYPPGLQYLSVVDTLLIHQQIELAEMTTGCETKNRYIIKNVLGQKVYYAKEVTDCCTRNCCGHGRPFDIKILDNFDEEVIHITRPLGCDCCCSPCCLEKVQVYSPPGTLIGTVHQMWSICQPYYAVKDLNKDFVLKIKGPSCYPCSCECCSDVNFIVYSYDGLIIGKITKQWGGMIREMFTDADNFGVRFPMDLDVHLKALLIGATFLIDFMHFEYH